MRLCLVALCLTLLSACSSEPDTLDPKTLPYTLEPARELESGSQTVDLDGDGYDEIAYTYTPSHRPPGVQAVWIQTHDGQTIEQVNFEGRILPLHFLDLNKDGALEIFVPYIRNDSLFLSVVDAQGQKQFSFFLIDGQPRYEPDGVLPWDPTIIDLHLTDLNGDGHNELVSVITTGFARLPRGVLVHGLPGGQLLGKQIVGAAPANSLLGNFDDDEDPEVIIDTTAPNNGAEAGGFDDRHPYIIVFDLVPAPRVAWSRGRDKSWGSMHVAYENFDGHEGREFLVCTGDNKETVLEFVEPVTWRPIRSRTFAEPLSCWPKITTSDLDLDARAEILVMRAPGEIWVLNERLDVVQRRRVAAKLLFLAIWPDVDGDGVDEIVATTPSQILLLDPTLRMKAAFPGRVEDIRPGGIAGVMRRGRGLSPYLLLQKNREASIIAYELVSNPFHWWYRYSPYALWILGLAGTLGAGLGVYALRRRNRFMHRIYPPVFNRATNGLLVLDAQGRIRMANATLCDWLGFDAPGRIEHMPYDDAFNGMPMLVSFLHEVLTRDTPHHHEDVIHLDQNGQEVPFHISTERLLDDHRPFWLITLQKGTRNGARLDAQTWAMVVGEVAHEFRNPATGLLLTAQQLQAKYRRYAPDAAASFDPYAESIIERIDYLRRLSSNYMKFAGRESIRPVETDLNQFAQEMAERLRPTLASDFSLHVKLEPGLPTIMLDRELMQSVVQNLVSNAVNAMPEGGILTLATSLVSNLPTPLEENPRDYAVLEVRDTGVGISPTDHERLFELGFSTSEEGVGLGLAIVKKAVDGHTGFIKVESEPGMGSVFSIYLPTII